MIYYQTHRDRQEVFAGFIPPEQALETLAICELAYGGQITELEPTTIAIASQAWSTWDFTRYTGTAADMQHLVQLAAWHQWLSADCGPNLAEQGLDEFLDRYSSWPIYLARVEADNVADVCLWLALIGSLGEQPGIEMAMRFSDPGSLLEALKLNHEFGIPLREVL